MRHNQLTDNMVEAILKLLDCQITIPSPYQCWDGAGGGGVGLPKKGWGGGFSGPNDKLDTDGQPYQIMPYKS